MSDFVGPIGLDEMRESAAQKYAALDVQVGGEVVRLLNPLRIPRSRRRALAKVQEQIREDGADQEELMREMIRLVAEDKRGADLLLKAVGDDMALLAEVITQYGKRTQPGEA